MRAKKSAKKVKSRKRSTKKGMKDLSPRSKAKSVKGGATNLKNIALATHNYEGSSAAITRSINPSQAFGDSSL